MKKYLLSVFAAASMLFATSSCSEEEELVSGGNGKEKVSFKIEMDGSGSASRSIGEGEKVTKIYYEVWEQGAAQPLAQEDCDSSTPVEPLGEGKIGANITLELVKGVSYDILFWAQSDNSVYNPTNLKNVTIDTSSLKANQESYDAFAAAEIGYKVQNSPKTVTLTRPFAQVNVGTSKDDWEKAKGLGVEISKSKVVVKKELFTKYDVSTGYTKGKVEEITYQLEEVLNSDNTFSVSGKTYHYLGMNYVLAAKNGKSIHDMDIELYDGDKLINKIEVTNMPIQRNHRTNVIGNLLTSEEAFEVVIDADFEDKEYGKIDGQDYIKVKTVEDFYAAFADEECDIIILDDDIKLTQSTSRNAQDPTLTISNGKTLTIDLNGKKLSATSAQTGKNYDMFDVRGTLTVKNGTMEYKHEGENMGWNSSTNLFNVTAGGVLNLEGVTAKNLGGSDMAFVAHLNNWGEVTLNVNNSTLESTYIPVRVFNSGNDMNNVTIKNSTLKGKYCFWVHNYKAAGDANGTDKTLNLDIYNSTNTFEYTGKAPVLYGFAEPIYLDKYGKESAFVATQDELNAALKANARINLKSGEYTLASYPAGVTLIGEKEGVVLDVKGQKFGVNGDVTIENAKLLFSNADYEGFQHTNVERYKNCVIAGQPFLYGNDVTFEDCTFEQTSSDAYNVWTYGAKNVKFVNCTFNSAGKSVLIYHENQGQKVSFEGCTLTATASVEGKAAIEIDSSLLQGEDNNYEIVINDTNAEGFGTGNVSGNILWNQKKGSKASITVDGKEVAKVAYSSVGNAESLTKVLANGVSGNVVLSQDVTAESATTAPYGNKYAFKLDGGVIDGNGHELHMECYGDDYGIMTSGGTIKNLTIKEGCRAVMIMYPQTDVILDNVNIGGDGVLYPINTGEAGAKGVDLIVTNSTLAGWTSYGLIESASFTNVKFEQGTYYNNIYGRVLKPYVNTTLTNCSFVEHMNLDLSALNAGHKIVIKNCTVNGQKVTADVFTIPTSDPEYDTALFTIDLPSWATSINDCVVFE